jgi:hypothetical protein
MTASAGAEFPKTARPSKKAPAQTKRGSMPNDFGTHGVTFTGTIFGVPEVVPGINVKETISTVKFGINYRFGPIAGAY